MFPGAKIIAIDDDGNDLKAIELAFRSLGIACLTYQYPDERPADGIVFRGIRLFVTDINLLGATSPGEDAKTLAPVISLMERMISEDNGPYALITWSTTELHDALVARIKETASLSNRQPFFSTALTKPAFEEQPEKLVEAARSLFTEKAPFGALLDWERRVSSAGDKVLADVETFSKSFAGDDPSEKMDRMLSKLAVDAFGKSHVAEHVFESVNEALLPLLNDALNVEFFSNVDGEIWNQAVTKFNDDNALDAHAISSLNSSVVFEANPEIRRYRRGAVLALPKDWIEGEEFEKRFGATPNVIGEQVLKLDDCKALRWVLVQAQAACDFAQTRIGPIPYLLAAVVPADLVKKNKTLPASVWKSPVLTNFKSVSEVDFRFFVVHNIGCQLTRQLLEDVGFHVLGRLKDQIVASVAYEHHSHGSRPGYVSFR